MTTTNGALLSAVDAVVAQDLAELTVAQLQEAVAVAGPQAQRLAGFAGLASAALAVRGGGRLPTDTGGTRSVAGWVAETTSDTATAAGRLLAMATRLQQSLPGVAAALLDGRVGLAQAEILSRLVGHISDEALAEAEPDLILTAQSFDPIQLAACVRHQLATWVEPKLEQDEDAAASRRYLKTRIEADGSLWGSFRLPGGDAETVLTTIEPLARPAGMQDERSAAQRRADALIEVCEQVLRHGDLPDAGGERPRVTYVLPADWAARRAGEQSCPHCVRCAEHAPRTFADLVAGGVPEGGPGGAGRVVAADGRPVLPAEHACAVAAWTGPQTRARIESLLCDARISRLLLDELGQIAGLDELREAITPRQRRALAARDLGCAVRGCTRSPAMCDAHHLTARKDGGDHSNDNLVLLCRRHHVLWHLGKIRLRHLHVPWLDIPVAPPPPPRDPVEAAFAGLDLRR